MERAFAIPDNKKIIAVFVFLFFTGEWRSRLTVLILKNAKEDAQQLQSLFPYILGEKILRRENTYTLLATDSITAYSAELLGRLFFVFYLLGKWGKYAFAISKQDQKKNFLNYFSNQIKQTGKPTNISYSSTLQNL